MKPDYYTKKRTRTFHVVDEDTGESKKVKKTTGEHVMSLSVFKGLSVYRVLQMIGK